MEKETPQGADAPEQEAKGQDDGGKPLTVEEQLAKAREEA